ncbi:phosphoenolpyruvate synthase [Clostridium sp. YIM B02505]|uniref:Phosphoenolpyruvate synthase n=1 Tax=Clostridium yunnanense TaxID=2800325 RepID=A0ABS1EV52_9CLOT|nr:phosphoenolpyruvate synthase [Clostridium yunnanense]MBK1813263.1 phosphoenolpyruvate synthase [Clostridium yunnanense]
MYVINFDNIKENSLSLVGGKALNLGLLTKNNFNVPNGFVITTEAFKTFINSSTSMNAYYLKLNTLKSTDISSINKTSKDIISYIEALNIPYAIESTILRAFDNLDKKLSYAVRSSGTAEDLPGTSFAGQHESYLNIIGINSILEHVKKCWASLFTARAITYRIKNGFDHKKVLLSVIVQEMIPSVSSGVMFTADPITGNRKIVCINAVYGLGESLVQGIASPDLYKIKNSKIIHKLIEEKSISINTTSEGGIITKPLSSLQRKSQVLNDNNILLLSRLGKEIENYYNAPQDIEWGYYMGKFYILQSREITTLYPLPELKDDLYHVYMSTGHQQMMTNAIKPLGICILNSFFPFVPKKYNYDQNPNLVEAGNRIYADITRTLKNPILKNIFLDKFSIMDVLMSNAVKEVVSSEDFKTRKTERQKIELCHLKLFSTMSINILRENYVYNNKDVLERANNFMDSLCNNFQAELEKQSGAKAIRYIQINLPSIMANIITTLLPPNQVAMMAKINLEKKCKKWLGESIDISPLNKSLKGNVTTEMGLAIGDLADIARKSPEVVKYLKAANTPYYINGVKKIKGGLEFANAMEQFLDKYGMRCPGEIDITVDRWIENPLNLLPSILNFINSKSSNEHKKDFDDGLKQAEKVKKEIISKAKASGLNENKIIKLTGLIDTYRTGAALREHQKFCDIRIFWIIKKTLLKEASHLVNRRIIRVKEDIYYLSLTEIHDAISGNQKENLLVTIEKRKESFIRYSNLNPPRVLTSDGEAFYGNYESKDIPIKALPGIAVSQGTFQGIARVILNPNDAYFRPGEVLIAPFTDPGWTPLFVSSKALVTEIGGLMTHGAVIAREYGIPAVVGVENVTKLIKTGDRILVNGSLGYVQILN